MLGCEPYITGNVGIGTVSEMNNWVEYLNFDGQSPLTTLRKENGRNKPWNVSFWGVGNESWGCGGNMTPEFYCDQYNRYSTFLKNYPNARLRKIASGSYDDNYKWTETCMQKIDNRSMWGLSLHYYTIPGVWEKKGSATQFEEPEYFSALQNCLHLDELIKHHSAIMDVYDPEKKVALVVDEWGIWTDVEPGTDRHFLYQQNSLRDALIAASTLNMFNNHCDRVRMANLAQTINVLQALILTDKEKILLTPTYYVFDLFKDHQDATYLPVELNSPDYVFGNKKIKAINVSASRDKNNAVHISFVNLDPAHAIKTTVNLAGITWQTMEGQILTSSHFNDVNTFKKPNTIIPQKLSGAKKQASDLLVELPPKSIVVIELK
jgi:alpha-N-arabinofuranosidase